MNAQEAHQFIKRQFSRGNAWMNGPVIKYIARRDASFKKFKEAVQIAGGQIQKELERDIYETVERRQYECEAVIPGWQDPQSEIERLAPNGLLSVSEAAERLGYSVAWVRRLCQQGRIQAVKVGRDWLISEDAVVEYEPRSAGRSPQEPHQ